MQQENNVPTGANEIPLSKIERLNAALFWANDLDRKSFTLDEVKGPCRSKQLVRVRHLTSWRLRVAFAWSFPKIALELGGRDHATIMHGVKKINAEFDLPANYPIEIWRADMASRLDVVDQYVEAILGGLSLEECAFALKVPMFRLRNTLHAAGHDVRALAAASRLKRETSARDMARETYAAELLAKAMEKKRERDLERARRADRALAVSFGI